MFSMQVFCLFATVAAVQFMAKADPMCKSGVVSSDMFACCPEYRRALGCRVQGLKAS